LGAYLKAMHKVEDEEDSDEEDLKGQRDVWYQKINGEEHNDHRDDAQLFGIDQYPRLSQGRRH
jgi:hypothetical protein